MKKTRLKIKWKNMVLIIMFIICLVVFIISMIKIIMWFNDRKIINDEIHKIQTITNIEEVEDSAKTEIITGDVEESNPYWDYIKVKLINIDFKTLKEINSDVVGWIQVQGTNVNYPFVHTTDNNYYLNHSFNKEKNSAGWIFMDYRNKDKDNKNTILYAHGRLDKTMFGSLRNILKTDWIKNKDNYIIKTATEKENTLWQIFSIYTIPTTDDYIKTDFTGTDEFNDWANMLLKRSEHDFNTSINGLDKILTLSTCYDNNQKTVIHAKLIKREVK